MVMQEEKLQVVPKTFLVQLLGTHDDHTKREMKKVEEFS